MKKKPIKAWAIVDLNDDIYRDRDGKGSRYWIYHKRISPSRRDEMVVRIEIRIIGRPRL